MANDYREKAIRKQIADLYNAGNTPYEVSQKMGVSEEFVRRCIGPEWRANVRAVFNIPRDLIRYFRKK